MKLKLLNDDEDDFSGKNDENEKLWHERGDFRWVLTNFNNFQGNLMHFSIEK